MLEPRGCAAMSLTQMGYVDDCGWAVQAATPSPPCFGLGRGASSGAKDLRAPGAKPIAI
jgi:hypothetical protein